MLYSLDQRMYRLNISKKKLWEECNRRGRKIGYTSVCAVIDYPGEKSLKMEQKVTDTIAEMEKERGITDIVFDNRC